MGRPCLCGHRREHHRIDDDVCRVCSTCEEFRVQPTDMQTTPYTGELWRYLQCLTCNYTDIHNEFEKSDDPPGLARCCQCGSLNVKSIYTDEEWAKIKTKCIQDGKDYSWYMTNKEIQLIEEIEKYPFVKMYLEKLFSKQL